MCRRYRTVHHEIQKPKKELLFITEHSMWLQTFHDEPYQRMEFTYRILLTRMIEYRRSNGLKEVNIPFRHCACVHIVDGNFQNWEEKKMDFKNFLLILSWVLKLFCHATEATWVKHENCSTILRSMQTSFVVFDVIFHEVGIDHKHMCEMSLFTK